MRQNTLMRGFTLIELLVVIAIIGLLASIVFVSLVNAKKSAQDIRVITDFRQINTALNLFFAQKGKYPVNHNCNGLFCAGAGNFGACDGTLPGVPGGGTTNNVPTAYNASMQELVDAGLIGSIPHSKASAGYCYFDFGAGTPTGALVNTVLESGTPSATGKIPSCRPNPPNNATWCESTVSLEYCLCNPY